MSILRSAKDLTKLWRTVFQRVFVLWAIVIPLAAVPAYSRDANRADPYPALAGLRYGISVTDLDGNILVAHRADERFTPASNVKLFVTAAALAAQTKISALDAGLKVVLEPTESGPPALVLIGHGDPTIGAGANCNVRCIETLAAAVAASGIGRVGDIIGDDQWFADERRPLGWSWDDLKFGHGTSISAIAVNDNILSLRVSPARAAGTSVRASWADAGQSYFALKNGAKTGEATRRKALRLERRIGERTARLYGELPIGSKPMTLDLGVDDPAHFAAWTFKRALEAKGVSVSGQLRTRRRPLQYADEPQSTDPGVPDAPASAMECIPQGEVRPAETVIASLPPAPLQDIVTEINRNSQNLYAEVLLRQLGRTAGRGSSFCGLLQIQNLLEDIGAPRTSYDIADGSGLSSYNRASPATITALLRHAVAAPWGEAYRASLPVGGASAGSLKYRFRGSALEGKIFAKTGTLNHVDALSGYMEARSGQMLIFSIIVNDRPLDSPSAMRGIDSTLLMIAEQY
ncbi:MAG: D-alanyl-D-alanine carboxypeptidase/D-alanyl-D-alanine-endopeptidase [Pseudomonadota bacterium]